MARFGQTGESSMSSDEPTSAPTDSRRRILWLIVGHIVVGLMGAFVAYPAGNSPSLRGAAFLGIVFSQTSLLGIWGGLGSNPWWQRVIGVVVGVGYLGTLLGVGISEPYIDTYFVSVLATTFVAMSLLIARSFAVVIHPDSAPRDSVVPIQFSIRHLMILTFVIACLITIGEWTQPHFPLRAPLALLNITATFAGVGVLPVWFMLDTKKPLRYSVGIVAVAACVGYCVAGTAYAGEGLEKDWMTATATEAVALVVSLLVVRSCGYRLVRLTESGRLTSP